MTYTLSVLFALFGILHLVKLQEAFDTSNYRVLTDPKGRNFTYHAERCKSMLNFSLSLDLIKVNVFCWIFSLNFNPFRMILGNLNINIR